MQLCSLELLILCFSTAKGSENRWVHLNLAYICLGPAFSGLWWRISWILNFTCLDAILFTKVAHTLFQHISEKRKPLSLLQSGLWFPRTSIFWTWWRFSLILAFTCLDAIMFAKVAQTLFQHFLGSEKRLVCWNLRRLCLGSAIYRLLWRIWSMPDFTCLDENLFAKVAQTLLQHISSTHCNFKSALGPSILFL